MTTDSDIQRSTLPIPDRARVMVTTYDATDPNTRFAPIELIRRAGAHAKGRAPRRGRSRVHAVPHDGAALANAAGATDRPQPSFGRHGLRHRDGDVRAWLCRAAARQQGAAGFEYFYGFLGGECNQYEPGLYQGTTPVTPPRTAEEGYHLTEDLADKAINGVRQLRALIGNTKPFFMYFAPGATHAPHHVPKEWADRYQGKFDHGWDRQRELTFARRPALTRHPRVGTRTRQWPHRANPTSS